MLDCLKLSQKFQSLHSLQEQFSTVYEQAKTSRDFALTRKLKSELEQGMKELELLLFDQGIKDTLIHTYKNNWSYNEEQLRVAEQATPSLISPIDIDWQRLKDNPDPAKIGEYTLNPDTQGIDFANYPPEKIKVLDLANMRGKNLAEVGEFLTKTYGTTHHIPGLEYWKYISENPNKAPRSLKDGKYHHFFGSILRNQDGLALVPYVHWHSSKFDRDGGWLDYVWDANLRVVLLEK